jgi:two-component system chemotaxis response regulator CheB
MAPIRVLVVDDSAVARRLVSEALCTDAAIEVAGTASNGRLALQKLFQFKPQVDAVTLDVEMPEMDGIQTLVEIRKYWPHLPVIMFSAITERGAAATLDAIARGANDYVCKPTSAESLGEARRRVADDLCPRVKAFAAEQVARLLPPPPAPAAPLPPAADPFQAPSPAQAPAPFRTRPARLAPSAPVAAPAQPAEQPSAITRLRAVGRTSARPEVLLIGVSTGGPNALAELIPALPADFPLPVLVTQHMPPVFTRLLADRLDAVSQLEVRECQGDEKLKAGYVYIAKGDYHMKVKGSRTDPRLYLDQAPPENSCRPAVDAMFRSAVELWGGAAIGVILTGMGQDGLKGCQLLRDAGGQILAQDQATSVIWGMPGAIARAGLADRILPLKKISSELVTLTAALSGVPARRINP